ncbi:discoidin domain-containing protein [Candidatus Saccharibacteria bacterium]|jgi:hypothetical protein|nr:discoidin domain-containing protein [Candidatus Saccharibacteria bacterium]
MDKKKQLLEKFSSIVIRLKKRTIKASKKPVSKTVSSVKKIPKTRIYKKTKKLSKATVAASAKQTKRVGMAAKIAHHQAAVRPHNHLMKKWSWYETWHHKRYYKVVNASIMIVGLISMFGLTYTAFAAQDDTQAWTFNNPSDYTFNNSKIEPNNDNIRLKLQDTINNFSVASGQLQSNNVLDVSADDTYYFVSTDLGIDVIKQDTWDRVGYITSGGGFNTIDVANDYLYAGKNGGIYRWKISTLTDNTPLGIVRYSTTTSPALGDQNIQKININKINSKVYVAVSTPTYAHIIKDEQGTPSVVKATMASGWTNNGAYMSDDGALYYDMRSNGNSSDGAILVKYNAILETNDWTGWTQASVDYGNDWAPKHGPNLPITTFTGIKVAQGTSTASAGDNTIYIETEKGLIIIQENRTTPNSSTINDYVNNSRGPNLLTGASAQGRYGSSVSAGQTNDSSVGSYYINTQTLGEDWLEYDLGSSKTFNYLRQEFYSSANYTPDKYIVESSTQGTSANMVGTAVGWSPWANTSYPDSNALDSNYNTGYIGSFGADKMQQLYEFSFGSAQSLAGIDYQFYDQNSFAKNYEIEGSTSQTKSIIASTAASSSTYYNDPSYGPLKTIDRNTGSRWISNVPTNTVPQWLQLDLGSSQSIAGLSWINENGYTTKNFSIDYSNDATNWNSAYSTTNNTSQSNRIKFNSPVTGRYIRLNVTNSGSPNNGDGVRIYEIEALSSMFESGSVTTLDTVTNNTSVGRQSNFNPTSVKSFRLVAKDMINPANVLAIRTIKAYEKTFDGGTVTQLASVSGLNYPSSKWNNNLNHDIAFSSKNARYLRIRYPTYGNGNLLISDVKLSNSSLPDYSPSKVNSSSLDTENGQYYSAHSSSAPEDGRLLRIDDINVNSPTIGKVINKSTKPELANDQFTSVKVIDKTKLIAGTTGGTSFIGKRYAKDLPTIETKDAYNPPSVASWSSFSETATKNGGEIYYQISNNNGANWNYWNGSSWVEAEPGEHNTASEVSANINDFDIGTREFKWRAFLSSNGSQEVTLSNVTLVINPDVTPPAQNASNIIMHTESGGQGINEDDWTNANKPYFDWDAAVDDSDPGATGIKGYCLYLGKDSTADPKTTKGILGTGSLDTSGTCPFAVSANSLDLSLSSYIGSALTSSNTPYSLIIQALDYSNNIFSGAPASFSFRFDNTPPSNPAYVSAPSQFVASKAVNLTWPTNGVDAGNDANSGYAGMQYKIGNSTWYGDNHSGSQDTSDLLIDDGTYSTVDPTDFDNITEGNNTIYFRSWDSAGNVSPTYTTTVLKLNTSSPSSPQNVSSSPSSSTSNAFQFSWEKPATFQGSANNLTYCYTINTLPTENTCTYTEPGITSIPVGPYANQPGDNTFYVVARDEANNLNFATAASTTFTANTSAPGVPLELDIADVSTKTTSTWRLALSWNPPSQIGAGVDKYAIYRSTDNQNFTKIASTSGTSYVDGNLNQKDYHYRVKACDSANNCGANSSTVKDYPTGKFTSPATITAQPSVSAISTKRAVVRWSTNRKSDSKISIGTSKESYQPFQIASNDQTTDHKVDLNNLTPGTTYFAKASWTDEDGNTGNSSEFTFKTNPAPSTQEVEAIRVTLSAAQIRFTSIGATRVVIQYGLSDSFGAVKEIATSLDKSTYDVELEGLNDGAKYLYRLNTFDADGNEYAGSTVLSFSTPARPKIENLRFQPVEGEATSTQRITWTTNVATSSLIRFSAKDIASKEISDSNLVTEHEIIVRDLLDDTEYSFKAESRDKDGNLATSDSQVLRTALDTRPPKISDVTVETTIRGSGSEARGQIVLSWKTDEPATGQVAYGEGSNLSEFNSKTSEDASLSTEHIVIVSDLPTSKVYSVVPISNDNAKNNGTGEPQSAIIGRASDDIISIVLNTLKKVFGF